MIEGTHQHAKSGKVYAYRADWSTSPDGEIRWQARIEQAGVLRAEPQGRMATGTPAADTIAEKAVLDAVLKAIDALEDGAGP